MRLAQKFQMISGGYSGKLRVRRSFAPCACNTGAFSFSPSTSPAMVTTSIGIAASVERGTAPKPVQVKARAQRNSGEAHSFPVHSSKGQSAVSESLGSYGFESRWAGINHCVPQCTGQSMSCRALPSCSPPSPATAAGQNLALSLPSKQLREGCSCRREPRLLPMKKQVNVRDSLGWLASSWVPLPIRHARKMLSEPFHLRGGSSFACRLVSQHLGPGSSRSSGLTTFCRGRNSASCGEIARSYIHGSLPLKMVPSPALVAHTPPFSGGNPQAVAQGFCSPLIRLPGQGVTY